MNEEEFTTTFWLDFSVAERFGLDAIKDTYKRAFDEWKNDVRYMTDLVLTLNHKIWQHYEQRPKLAEIYNDLWSKADNYCCDKFTGEDLQYFYRVTD